MKLIIFSYYLILMLIICVYFILFKNYFLMFLISLEFFGVLILCGILFYESSVFNWLFIYYLIFMVCDAILGLSILVSMMKLINKESLMIMNLKC